MIVVENGKIVSSYVREDVDPTKPFQIWSATKSWIGLLVGIMLRDGQIKSLDESLGDIFINETDWNTVTNETNFRKNVTLRELLTMTSGLVSPPFDEQNMEASIQELFASTAPNSYGGGKDLPDSLAYPWVAQKGQFSYLGISNIMSYVLLQLTGLSPRQFLAQHVLPALGINDGDIGWWTNSDGVEYAFHGLELTAYQMAKFGQLYLQGGFSNHDDVSSVVPKEWIQESLRVHTDALDPYLGRPQTYGYFFWSGPGSQYRFDGGCNPKAHRPLEDNSVWCALGFGGQDICVHKNLGRVTVQQRDFDPSNVFSGDRIGASIAMDPSLSFDRFFDDDSSCGNWYTAMGGKQASILMVVVIVAVSFLLYYFKGGIRAASNRNYVQIK